MKRIITTILSFFVLIPATCFALDGRVVGVSDGDTVTILTQEKQQIKVRLYGVDCPESHQDYGQRAKQFTSDMVFGKTVDLETIDQDKYGRSVGIIRTDGRILNEELLKNGFAWHYAQYCKRPECGLWKQFEEQAKSTNTGLWAVKNPVAPWDFRHGNNAIQEKKENSGLPDTTSKAFSPAGSIVYHGNAKSHVFHAPGCRYYDCGNCFVKLSSRDEALKGGYRPCGICRP